MKKAKSLMIQGTTSDAGKSTLVAALCRLFSRQGVKVAPFKPQNMALNSAVTSDGGEIGRAQAVQAIAAGVEADTDMNPILLKPSSDQTAQVIIHGKAVNNQDAKAYHDYKKFAMTAVLESYHRLQNKFDLILIEGAGSPAEINLRKNDIANMGFAEKIDCPVILIADIDRGGVFAHIIGTLQLLSNSERKRIKGFVINRFRGDIALLQSGLDWLQEKTHTPVLGVLPYLQDFHLEAEDALPEQPGKTGSDRFNIIVPALPRISNHTDFDPLRLHPEINLQFIAPGQTIPAADLIILPGSKAVIDDLAWLRSQGWESAIKKHIRYGGKIMGICGGFQMLGMEIYDPLQIESEKTHASGLGLLDIETRLMPEKALRNIEGRLRFDDAAITGYEIHSGETQGPDTQRAVLSIGNRNDGAISEDNQVLGCYIHGLFESQAACSALLHWAGFKEKIAIDYHATRDREIDRLANTVEKYLNTSLIEEIIDSQRKQS